MDPLVGAVYDVLKVLTILIALLASTQKTGNLTPIDSKQHLSPPLCVILTETHIRSDFCHKIGKTWKI
jgi:hypothetical protein